MHCTVRFYEILGWLRQKTAFGYRFTGDSISCLVGVLCRVESCGNGDLLGVFPPFYIGNDRLHNRNYVGTNGLEMLCV